MNRFKFFLIRRIAKWRKRGTPTYDTVEYVGPHSPLSLREVLSRELDYIQRNRHPGQPVTITQRSMIGLALSGGGIRSATTNLGILQALSRMEVLPLVDYLCTVSGGGYIGTCLSSLLSWNGQAPTQVKDQCARFTFASGQEPVFTTEWGRFPFRAEILENKSRVGGDIVGHLRTHGNFLVAHLGVLTRHTMRAVGNFLTGILLNVAAFLLILFTISAVYLTGALRVAPDLPRIMGIAAPPTVSAPTRPQLLD